MQYRLAVRAAPAGQKQRVRPHMLQHVHPRLPPDRFGDAPERIIIERPAGAWRARRNTACTAGVACRLGAVPVRDRRTPWARDRPHICTRTCAVRRVRPHRATPLALPAHGLRVRAARGLAFGCGACARHTTIRIGCMRIGYAGRRSRCGCAWVCAWCGQVDVRSSACRCVCGRMVGWTTAFGPVACRAACSTSTCIGDGRRMAHLTRPRLPLSFLSGVRGQLSAIGDAGAHLRSVFAAETADGGPNHFRAAVLSLRAQSRAFAAAKGADGCSPFGTHSLTTGYSTATRMRPPRSRRARPLLSPTARCSGSGDAHWRRAQSQS
jgi:hypothetical protein